MRLTQTLPILFSPEPSGGLAGAGARRGMFDRLSCVFTPTRKLARTAADNSRLSANVSAWEHCRMDYQL